MTLGMLFFIFRFRASCLWNEGTELDAAYSPLPALTLHDFEDFIITLVLLLGE